MSWHVLTIYKKTKQKKLNPDKDRRGDSSSAHGRRKIFNQRCFSLLEKWNVCKIIMSREF
jgi:hypothetical protein